MLRLMTNEQFPLLMFADTPDSMVLLFRMVYWYTPTNAAYMRRANAVLTGQGRPAVDTEDEGRFLQGMAEAGVIRMEESY